MHKKQKENKTQMMRPLKHFREYWIRTVLPLALLCLHTVPLQASPPDELSKASSSSVIIPTSFYELGKNGYQLFTQLYHRYWQSPQRFSSVRLPLTPTTAKPCKLAHKQAILDKRQIDIQLEEFPETLQTYPIRFDLGLYRKTHPQDGESRLKDASRVTTLTFDHLDQGLKIVCNEFSRQVDALKDTNFSYATFFQKYKSAEWITARMLRLLPAKLMPSGIISEHTYPPKPDQTGFLNITLMDECHYSGSQVESWFNGIVALINLHHRVYENTAHKKLRIWILAPFVSSFAEDRIKSFVHSKTLDQDTHLDIRLIATDLTFPKRSSGVYETKNASPGNNTYLLLPEWKLIDRISFPVDLLEFCNQSLGATPLYKSQRCVNKYLPSVNNLHSDQTIRQISYPALPREHIAGSKYLDPESLPFFISALDAQKLQKIGLTLNNYTGVVSGEVLESVRMNHKPFFIFVHQPVQIVQVPASQRFNSVILDDYMTEVNSSPPPYRLKIDLRISEYQDVRKP